MKIGVITHWWCFENYGQILQGYAFQQFLKGRGHDPFIIKFKPFSEVGEPITIFRIARKLLHPIAFFRNVIAWCSGRVRLQKGRRDAIESLRGFDTFRSAYMKYNSHVYRTAREMFTAKDIDADMYSVGSDVVWKYVPFNDQGRCFFLQFGREGATRIAYSPSFGNTNLSDDYKRFVSPLLSNFKAISVREPSGVRLCAEMGRKDAVCVLDPVFLLPKEDWMSRFNVPLLRRGVFGYFLSNLNGVPVKEIGELPAAQNGFKITTVYDDMNVPTEILFNPTIPEWVRLIGSSEVVVTNSFHGTSMAIIMQTPFIVCLKNGGKAMDDRLISLLDRLGLTERIWGRGALSINSMMQKPIDWKDVKKRLEKELSVSLNFLSGLGI